MKLRLLAIIALVIVLSASLGQLILAQGPLPEPAASSPESPQFVPERLLVKFYPETVPPTDKLSTRQLDSSPLAQLMTEQGVQSARVLFPAAAASGQQTRMAVTRPEQIYYLTLEPGRDARQTAAALAADPGVEWAEPDYIAYPATAPTDPLYPSQWGLAKIKAPAAWDVVTGTTTVVVALIDSGIDLTHPDLTANLWLNPGEIAANGLDDDNNGYVDDVRGWNFVSGSADVSDGNGHGTQVAGVIAAATNNDAGIAGLCWNCRLLPVRVMADSGASNYSDIALGVRYAADKGAQVINLSLGGYANSNALQDAITYAVSKGAVVVGGAGNDNLTTPFYPAAYDNVLAVAGTDKNDAKASFSNYGAWTDISAPGEVITTTFLGGDYGPASGTSLSAPFVSGLAALIRSLHPDWSAALVRNQILQTAEVIDASNPSYIGLLGAGRINAAVALQSPHPVLTLAGITVNGSPQGRPIPGASAELLVTLSNTWWDAQAVTGVLTTADPFVSLTQATATYGDLPSGASSAGSPAYAFTVAAGAGYNHPLRFDLAITADNGAYTATFPLTITTRSGNEPLDGQTIAADTLWTRDKTYLINGNLGIAPGYTLTIEAGTEVRFTGNYALNVGGTLIANGTANQPISFSGENGAAWNRIFFDDPSADAVADSGGVYQSGNVLRHVTVDGAANGIDCTNATPYLDHVTLTGGGMDCAAGDTALWVQDSDLKGNVQISEGSGVDSVMGTWATRSSMPTARHALAVATAPNGKIYAIGGYNNGSLATVEEYDPVTDSWATRTPMPTARFELGVVAASNGKLYAIGGAGGAADVVEEYDPATDTWVSRAPLPTARYGLAVATASNGKIYAIGGVGGSGYLATVEEYDPATDTWANRAPLSTARYYLAAATAPNGKIYAIGGNLTTVEEYDPTTDTWSNRTPLPTARSYLAAATAPNGKLYAIGGSGTLATVEEYDPATDTWANRAPLSTARYYLATATAPNGKLYAIGGYGGSTLATMEEFTPPTDAYGYHILRSTLSDGLNIPDSSQVLTSTLNGSVSTGKGSLIQNSTVNGSISAGSGSMVKNNSIAVGGISTGDGSTVRDNSVENAPGWAIQTSGNVTVQANRLVNNANGILATGGGTVQGNLIANTAGVGLEIGSVTVEDNTFTGNGGSAIKITAGVPVKISGNNFEFNTGGYDIENRIAKASLATIDTRNNWWGTTAGTDIGRRIFDFNDDYTLGTVLYSPVLSQPATVAPAYVRSVTLTPASPVGIQPVEFKIGFSREMDETIFPEIAFQSVKNETWDVYNTSNSGLPDNQVYSLAVDGAGTVWVGTWGGGLARFDKSTWTIYNTDNSLLPSNYVYSLAIDGTGSVWAGTGDGLAHFDGSTWTVYNTGNSGLPDDYVSSVAVAENGSVWVGSTVSGGLARFDGSTWTVYNPNNSGLPDWMVGSLVVERDGSVWVGTWSGLARFDGSTWAVYNTSNSGLPSNYVRSLAVVGDGSVWAGTSGGPAHFNNSTWTVYNIDNSSLPANEVYSLTVAENGSVWAGFNGGLARFDGSTWMLYNTGNSGLLDNNVHSLTTGGDGSVWAGTDNGLGVLWRHPLYPVQSEPQWLDATHYRAAYDFSTLIPRGTYTLTVSGAQTPPAAGGMKIASDTATTFTVDYAGYINDTTPPLAPVVTVCSAATPDTLSAQWQVNDPESAVTLYQYAIGSTPAGAEVVNWTTIGVTTTTRTNLALTTGQMYYLSVKARNEGGLWSEAGSAGVTAGSGDCTVSVSAPLADFSATPLEGQPPLSVTFTDASTGTITGLAWDFGDGNSSAAQNPTHVYSQTGVYTVTLTASSLGGSHTLTRTNYITVSAVPVQAGFVVTPASGINPLVVTFTNTSTGDYSASLWNFGDNSTSLLTHPTHTYTSAGVYTVTLTASGLGGSDTLTRTSYITVSVPVQAEVVVTPTSLTIGEPAGSGSFNLRLTSQPTATVTINLVASDTTECTVPTLASLTTVNWQSGVTVTVSAVDDLLADGNQPCTIQTAAASADPSYNGTSVADVTVTVTDDDSGGVVVTPTSLTIGEPAGSGSFNLRLTSQPTATVTINLVASDTTECTVPTSASLTTVNWQSGVTVTVSAVDDLLADGNQPCTIQTAAASADPSYNGTSVADVTVTVTDDDSGGVVVTPTSLIIGEPAGSGSFNLRLTSQPTATVTINLVASDTTECTVPTSASLTTVNWQSGVTVTVSAVDDLLADGNQPCTIQTAAASADPSYNGTSVADVTVTVTDDDSGPDSDGVDDLVENNAPNNGDGNNDGIPDNQQSYVASLPDATGSGDYLTLAAPANLTLRNVRAITNPAPGTAPAGVTFPQAFVEFEIENISVGGAVSVTLTLHGGTIPAGYWKYGATSGNVTPHWYAFNYDGTTGAVINGNQVTLYFIDGQRGDSDLSANGRIVDPGGAGNLKVYMPIVIKN